MTADGIAANLELLGVPVAILMISTQPTKNDRLPYQTVTDGKINITLWFIAK